MALKKRIRKLAVLFLVLCVTLGSIGSFSAFAATTKEITLTTNSDDNPFIRVPLYSSLFKTGGPFTVRCEIKIDSYTATKSDANIFVNIVDGRDSSQMTVWLNTWKRKTNGWTEMKTDKGGYITFDNINKVQISGAFEDFGLLQFGSYYAKAVIHYRNFRILNAAGEVVYSWDEDSKIAVGNDIRDLETNTIYAETFGDGSADYIISESDGGDGPTVTDPIVTDPPVTQTPTDPTPGKTDPTDPDPTAPTDPTDPIESGDTTSEASTDTTSAEESSENTTKPANGNPVSSNPDMSKKGGLGVGAIVGIVIGGIVVAAGAVFGVLYATKKLPWQHKTDGTEEPKDD